jgi:hypothetical protein
MNKSSLRGAIGGGGKENQQTLPPPEGKKRDGNLFTYKIACNYDKSSYDSVNF